MLNSILDFLLKILSTLFSGSKPIENDLQNNTNFASVPVDIDLKGHKKWEYIVIHHSATTDANLNDWEAIRKWHMGLIGSDDPKSPDFNKYVKEPMRDIGYHFGIERENGSLVYRTGRSLSWDGGHAIGFNNKGIGICVVGSYDNSSPTEEYLKFLINLCKILMRCFSIPSKNVIGHWETFLLRGIAKRVSEAQTIKSCPGKKFDLTLLREKLVEL